MQKKMAEKFEAVLRKADAVKPKIGEEERREHVARCAEWPIKAENRGSLNSASKGRIFIAVLATYPIQCESRTNFVFVK
jgi:hypothetical protein